MQRYDGVADQSAAGLNRMEFPALKKNPFFIKKSTMASPVTSGGEGSKIKIHIPISSKIPNSGIGSPLCLSPAQHPRGPNTVGKSHGVTSCFTADTIEKMLEETPSFAISGEYNNQSRSRNSAQEAKNSEIMMGMPHKVASAEKIDLVNQTSRRSTINKLKSNLSRERSVSKGGREGSALRSNHTGASPKRSPLKVFNDFMKDI